MKKFLCSLAILATMLGITSCVLAKEFADVKGTKYEEAVHILTELNIVNGYDDGTYLPENQVKRVEMAKLIVVAMGKENDAKLLEGKTKFSDIQSKHSWATGYINLASNLGIITGYPDGSFRPDDPISYVEASKMLLSALNYGDELNALSWPTGYMTKANSIGILDDVSANSSSDKANRGNIAKMILNTLNANTRKVTSTVGTTKTYGNDITLIEKAFPNYKSVQKGVVTSLDVNGATLTVQDANNTRKITVDYYESDIKEMLGRIVSFLYNNNDKSYLSFEVIDDYKVEKIDIDYIDEDEEIIVDEDGEEYALPKDNYIVFANIDNFEDAETAYLTLNDKKVTYVLLEGTGTLSVATVYDESINIGDEKGIAIVKPDGKTEQVLLANTKNNLDANDVILYTYEGKNRINYQKVYCIDDAVLIDKLTDDSIALEDEDKVTFKSESDYEAYMIDGYDIDEIDLDEIDSSYDTAVMEKIGKKYYIIVFMNGTDEFGTSGRLMIYEKEVKALKNLLSEAKSKKESNYSTTSWKSFKKVYDKVKDEYDDLYDVEDIEDYDDDEIQDEIDYVRDLKDDIQTALDGLLSKQDDIKRTNALNRIQNWLDAVEGYDKESWEDVDSPLSWKNLTKKIDEVEEVLYNEEDYTLEELQKLALELEDYIVV